MIPVRVEAGLMPVLASQRRISIVPGHLMYLSLCPACERPLGEGVTVLVLAGIAPENRQPGGCVNAGTVAVHAACAGVPDEEPTVVAPLAGKARCGSDWDDPEEGPAQCPELSRFIVARSDFDTSFGENGGSAEACERHLAGTVAGMIGGDGGIRAVVTVRWDPPTGGQEAATAAAGELDDERAAAASAARAARDAREAWNDPEEAP